MSKTRNNHYVPQWYQEGFIEPGSNTLAYLDLTPKQVTLADGRVIKHRDLFGAPTSRAFHQYDLYSTFFGTSVNDEIELLIRQHRWNGNTGRQGLHRDRCGRVVSSLSKIF